LDFELIGAPGKPFSGNFGGSQEEANRRQKPVRSFFVLHEAFLTMRRSMDCAEKIRLINEVKDKNIEFRRALNACHACQACGETRESCPLDDVLAEFEEAHAAFAAHAARHGC
jgi:hypothetical protein